MRIKLDENVPARAAERLRALGHDVDTVITEGLAGDPTRMCGRLPRLRSGFSSRKISISPI